MLNAKRARGNNFFYHEYLNLLTYCSPLSKSGILKLIKSAEIGYLATASPNLQPYVTPVVFIIERDSIYVPLDSKPKTVNFRQLKRIKNILENPKVAFLVEHYENDWSRLWFVMLTGIAKLVVQNEDLNTDKEICKVRDLFLEKYIQYTQVEIGTAYIKLNQLKGTFWRFKKTLKRKKVQLLN